MSGKENVPLHRCLNCGLSSRDLKLCSACNTAYYCSKNCQRTDWISRHSQEHAGSVGAPIGRAVQQRYTKLGKELAEDPSAFIEKVTVMPRPRKPDFLKPQPTAKPPASTRTDTNWQNLRKTQEAVGKEWLDEGEQLAREGRDFVLKLRSAFRHTLTDEARAEFDELLGRYDIAYTKFVREMHTEGRSMTASMQALQKIAGEIQKLFTHESPQPDPQGFTEFISDILQDAVRTAECASDAQQQQQNEADLERMMRDVEEQLGMKVGVRNTTDVADEEDAVRVDAEAKRNGVKYTSPDGYVTRINDDGTYERQTVEEAQKEHDERAKAMNDRELRKAFLNHVRFEGASSPEPLRTASLIGGEDEDDERLNWRERWQESEEKLQQRETRNRRARARSPRRGRVRNTNEREEEFVGDTRSEFNVSTGEWEERPATRIQERTTRIVEEFLGPTLGEDVADQTMSALSEFWQSVNQATFGEWAALVVSSGILTGIIGFTTLPWAATGDWVQDQRWIGTVNATSSKIMTRALERHGEQARDISMHTWRSVFEEHGLAFHVADSESLQEQDFLDALTTFSTGSGELASYMSPELQRLMNESEQTLQVFFSTVWENLVKNNRMGLNDEEMQSAVGHLHSMMMEMWRKAMDADTPAKMESQLKICSAIVNSMMEGGTEALFKITNEGVGLTDPRGTLEAVGDMINGSVAFNDISLRALMASQSDKEVRDSIKIPFEAIKLASEPGRRAAEALPYSAGIAATIVEQYPSTPLVGRIAFALLDTGTGITRLESSYQQLMNLASMSIAQDGLASYFSVLGSVGWSMFNLFTFFPIISYAAEGLEQLFGWLENAAEAAAEFFSEYAEKIAAWGSAASIFNKLATSNIAWGLFKIAQGLSKTTQKLSQILRISGHFLKKILEATRAGTAKARAASVALMSSYFFLQFMVFSAQLGWAFVTFFAPPIPGLYTGTLWNSLGVTIAEAVDSYQLSAGGGAQLGGASAFGLGWVTYLMVFLARNQFHFLYSWPNFLVRSAISSVRHAIAQPERMQSQIFWLRAIAMATGIYMTWRGSGQVETTFSADLDIKQQPNLWFMNDQTMFEDTTDSYRMLNHITNSSGLTSAMKASAGSLVDESLVREWWRRTYDVDSFEQFIKHGTVTYDHRITFDEMQNTLETYWRNLTGLESLFEGTQ